MYVDSGMDTISLWACVGNIHKCENVNILHTIIASHMILDFKQFKKSPIFRKTPIGTLP